MMISTESVKAIRKDRAERLAREQKREQDLLAALETCRQNILLLAGGVEALDQVLQLVPEQQPPKPDANDSVG